MLWASFCSDEFLFSFSFLPMLSAFEEFGSSDVDGSQAKITKAVSQKTNS